MASVTGSARNARVALRSGAGVLLAPGLTRLACTALCVAGVARTRTALCVTGVGRTRAALRVAGVAGTRATLGIASLTSGCARILTAVRVAGTASGTLRPRACIALRPRTGIVTRKPEVRAGDGNRRSDRSQLYIKIKLVRGCTRIMLAGHALCRCY